MPAPASIPARFESLVMEQWLDLKSPRAIAQALKERGVHTTHTSVQRLIERLAVRQCDTQRGIAQALVRYRAAADQMLRIDVAAKMAEWEEIMRNPATDEDTRARARVARAFLMGSDQLAERRQKLAAIGTLDADRDLWALQRKGLPPDESEQPSGPAEAAAPTGSSAAEGPSVHPESVRFSPSFTLDSQQIEAYAPTASPAPGNDPPDGVSGTTPDDGGKPSVHPESVRFSPSFTLDLQQIEAYAPTASPASGNDSPEEAPGTTPDDGGGPSVRRRKSRLC
jgi:hypothetical protein